MTVFSSFFAVNSAFAQTNWVQTSAPNNNWACVASSADGSKLAACVNGGQIYLSSDSGVTWNQVSVGIHTWSSIVSSADGSMLFAVANEGSATIGHVISSTNSGAIWKTNSIRLGGNAASGLPTIACSGDGSKVVTAYRDSIYTSTNSGASWVSNSVPLPSVNFLTVASTPDGNKLIATGKTSPLWTFVSTNGGTTWATNNWPVSGQGVCACSADGNTLVAALPVETPAYSSSDGGTTWKLINSYPTIYRASVSANGTKIIAVALNGDIYTSSDSGGSWVTNKTYDGVTMSYVRWWGVASSADGNKLVAVSTTYPNPGYTNVGFIYTLQTTPTPSMNVTSTNGNLTLSWLLPSTNFVVQQNPDLSAGNWVTLTNPPTINYSNLNYQLSLTPTNASGFFRLSTPP